MDLQEDHRIATIGTSCAIQQAKAYRDKTLPETKRARTNKQQSIECLSYGRGSRE